MHTSFKIDVNENKKRKSLKKCVLPLAGGVEVSKI